MMTLKETTLVLAKIRAHHGNAPITDLEARTFHEELRADATLPDALEAVRRFYAGNDKGRWMLSGDVNAGIRTIRKARIPEQAEIGRLMDQAGIDSEHALAYRRRLIKAISLGQPVAQAHALAVEAAHRQAIEAPKPAKPRRKAYHFAGRGQTRIGAMSLKDTLGGAA
ncbi:hypothetical protein [uncultured Bifidobacterium sp.]|uniref:hypothetical protein n=1 Tax=uncultured Bifidobacterium sp. TaxID=165187 RepID=UPI002592E964|nr:hypothetical protein [uncultured Bifidobacterium sp.]